MNEGHLLLAIVLASIAVGIYAALRPDLFFPGVARVVNHSAPAPSKPRARNARAAAPRSGAAPVNWRVRRVQRVNPRSPHNNAVEREFKRSNVNVQKASSSNTSTADSVRFINTKELTQLARALSLKSQGATEQAAIEQAFECKKGAGKGWRRGKALYDLATTFEEGAPHDTRND